MAIEESAGPIGAFVDRLTGGTRDPDTRLRARVFIVFSVILYILCFGWGGNHLLSGAWWLGSVFVASGLVLVGIHVKLLLDRSLVQASHAIMFFSLAATALASYITGGLYGANVTMFLMLVVCAFFMLGKTGIVWAVLGFIVALVFQVGHWLGWEYPHHVPEDSRQMDTFLTWLSSATTILLFVLFYDRARRLHLSRIREADAAKSRFLASISHELRTPLHVLMGTNRLLRDTRLTQSLRENLEISQQNAETLLSLLDDLIDVSVLEQGRFSLVSRPFDPRALVESVAGSATHRCREAGLEFGLEVADGLPEQVRGDAGRMRQILDNLVSNAVKYTSRGWVGLSVDIPDPTRPGTLRFSVIDTGRGIPEQDQERIFDRFTQGDASLARRHEGAGLGLFVSRELARLMGGEIEVESREGKGSTFHATIPFEPPGSRRGGATAPEDESS